MTRGLQALNERAEKLGLKVPVISDGMDPTTYLYTLGEIVEAMCRVMDDRIAEADKRRHR